MSRTGPRRKMARQAARSVLPNATGNEDLRNRERPRIRHFLEQRGNPRCRDAGDPQAGQRPLRLDAAKRPSLFNDYQEVSLGDGTFEIVTEHRKWQDDARTVFRECLLDKAGQVAYRLISLPCIDRLRQAVGRTLKISDRFSSVSQDVRSSRSQAGPSSF